MSIHTQRLTFIVLQCLIVVLGYAQSTKPQIYIDPQGKHYTKQQFDSLKAANMGKPIAQNDLIEKENETQITFEVLTADPNQEFKQKWIGKLLPAFSLRSSKGKTINNASLKGKLIILNFWSTTCGPCLKEMPRLSELVDKYSNQDIVFLAPAPESASQIEKVLAKRKFSYTILPQAKTLFSALELEGYPYHFIVDRAGIIQDVYSGSMINPQTNESILDVRLVAAIDKASKK